MRRAKTLEMQSVETDLSGEVRLRRSAVRTVCAIAVAVIAMFSVCLVAGCQSSSTEDSFLSVDLAEGQASGMATDMGASPAGKTEFTLSPDRDTVKAYQEEAGSDASTADMLEEWIDAITTVTLDGRELSENPFNNWKGELESPQDDYDRLLYYDLVASEEDVTLTLPVALFDTFDEDGISEKHLSIEADGYDDVSDDVRFRKTEPAAFTIRVYDTSPEMGGTLQGEYELTDDELHSLPVQTGYESAANCGMAGLRSFYSEGVYLTDVLDAAGVEFGPGMSLQLRSGDSGTDNEHDGSEDESEEMAAYESSGSGEFTYEDLMGTLRYNYPAMWDDETTYDELGGATVYELLAADKDAWKGDDEQSKTLARIIGGSKVELPSPLICWESNEGVVAWGGVNPALQTFGSYKINPYSEYSQYKLHFGLKANEDGSINDEFTVPPNSTAISGIDIYPTPDVDGM